MQSFTVISLFQYSCKEYEIYQLEVIYKQYKKSEVKRQTRVPLANNHVTGIRAGIKLK